VYFGLFDFKLAVVLFVLSFHFNDTSGFPKKVICSVAMFLQRTQRTNQAAPIQV